MNNRLSRILILVILVEVLLAIIICVWAFAYKQRFTDDVTIVLDQTPQTQLEVELYDMYPGASKSYEIHLKADLGKTYNLALNFQKTKACTIAQFIDVQVKLGDELIDSAKLEEYLDGKKVSFPMDFDSQTMIDIEIIYSMDDSVGDEAQNTTADFNLILSAR